MIRIDTVRLERRIASINLLMDSHAGRVDLVGVSPDGTVSLRYSGMCTGCEYRPVTTAGTVEPALLDLPGVTRVRIIGAQVSAEALDRIRATLDEGNAGERAVRLVHRIEDEAGERT
jgi:Fe-S cluster biogenesis protein NfuA